MDAQNGFCFIDQEAHDDVLIGGAGFDAEGNLLAVQIDLKDFGAGADGGAKLEDALFGASGASGFELNAVVGSFVIELERVDAERNAVNRKMAPLVRNVRRESERGVDGVGFQTEKSAQERAHHHGGGPDLVRGAGGERLVVVPGEHFGDVAGGTASGEAGIGLQIQISGEWTMIAILGDGGPAGEERPDGAVVVATAAVER